MHCMQLLNCQAENLCGSTYIILADISVYHIDRHVYLAQYFSVAELASRTFLWFHIPLAGVFVYIGRHVYFVLLFFSC